MNDLDLGFAYLLSLSLPSIVLIFWYTLVFEAPRFIIPIITAGLTQRTKSGEQAPMSPQQIKDLKVSILLIGHNEEDSLDACVRSLSEQSFNNFDIVLVSDGSTDKMSKVAKRLVREGKAARALTTDLRGGKSSGINLAWYAADGDIVINVDCDCSFDRYAIEYILQPFIDPKVGAVCGDIAPRNGHASVMAQWQEIEYLQAISVGKRIGNVTDQIVCASGAFGAFRRTALQSVGGFDVGGGEDLDCTIRLRQAGWKIAFAPESICYTDVPTSPFQYIRQRLRWERDAIWVRFRKHAYLMNPFHKNFRFSEAFHEWDFALFNVASCFIFPVYMIWLATLYGSFTFAILISIQIALLGIDIMILALAAWTTKRPVFWRNLLYLPGYSLFMNYVMRPVRLWAYIEEWCFSGSHRDNYTPIKVRLQRPW